ncbi:MAG: NuoM family protein [bacterium]
MIPLSLLLVPVLAAGLIALLPEDSSLSKWLALAASLATVGFSVLLWRNYPAGLDGYLSGGLYEVNVTWIPSIGASFFLGIDGISLLFIGLTALLILVSVLFSWHAVTKRVNLYYSFLLLLSASMFGVFMARDLLLFYLFWEAMLLPMYFLIGIWGGARRIYASIKFVLYTLTGSLLMLVAIVVLHHYHASQYLTETMALSDLYRVNLPTGTGLFVFLAFLLSFAIKTPLFPLHTWLPDAHVEAPSAGSIILAGILLKVGIYGFIRLLVPFFWTLSLQWSGLVGVLAVVGIIYGGLVAWVQEDVKKLVAYSSISHLGFVVLGIFALSTASVSGGLLQGVIHGINTGALFLIVGIIYSRLHDRKIENISGLAQEMPLLSTFLVITSLASIGLPGTNGFVGEFFILTSSYESLPLLTIFAVSGVIVSALYMLRLLRECVFGEVSDIVSDTTSLHLTEVVSLSLLTIAIFVMGLYPKPFMDRLEPTVSEILKTARQTSGETTFDRGIQQADLPNDSEATQ